MFQKARVIYKMVNIYNSNKMYCVPRCNKWSVNDAKIVVEKNIKKIVD